MKSQACAKGGISNKQLGENPMNQPITVSDNMLGSLKATRPWVMFLAILGFVFMGFMVLASLIMFVGFSAAPVSSKLPPFVGAVLGALYIALAVVAYLIPCLYLLRYGNAITRIQTAGQPAMEDALRLQKSFWKYVGILMIVVLVVYVLFIIGAIAFAVMYGSMPHP
jgi:hypothetical protein